MLYNIEDIKKIIPHRYPFLLVDRIEEVNEDENGNINVKGYKCVSANEPFFQGHFPDYNVMPGVLILEAMAQCGAVGVLSKEEHKGKIVLFTGANKVKWRQQVVPGDVLSFDVTINGIRHNMGFGSGSAYVDGKLVCSAEISFAIK
ncbi:MAG: 3-hydroxyacyl-ACP dehydratase FabZ [Anaeroplasmataceae bacterium]